MYHPVFSLHAHTLLRHLILVNPHSLDWVSWAKTNQGVLRKLLRHPLLCRITARFSKAASLQRIIMNCYSLFSILERTDLIVRSCGSSGVVATGRIQSPAWQGFNYAHYFCVDILVFRFLMSCPQAKWMREKKRVLITCHRDIFSWITSKETNNNSKGKARKIKPWWPCCLRKVE